MQLSWLLLLKASGRLFYRFLPKKKSSSFLHALWLDNKKPPNGEGVVEKKRQAVVTNYLGEKGGLPIIARNIAENRKQVTVCSAAFIYLSLSNLLSLLLCLPGFLRDNKPERSGIKQLAYWVFWVSTDEVERLMSKLVAKLMRQFAAAKICSSAFANMCSSERWSSSVSFSRWWWWLWCDDSDAFLLLRLRVSDDDCGSSLWPDERVW